MATPIRLKRSSVTGKRPVLNDLQLGELALNFYDGYLWAKRDTGGVGIGTTIALLTPWTENFGAGSIYYSNSVGIGITNPGEKLDVFGNLRIGGSSYSNYIAFYGTVGDQDGPYTHTYIGERIWSPSTEKSELFIFKGNDALPNEGEDRIRLAAAQVRIDTYTQPTSGNFESVAESTNLINRVVIHSTGEVGIGTDVLVGTEKLQVSGSVYFSENLIVSGITTTNSLSIGSTQVISSDRQLQNIVSLDATTTATIESAIANAPNTFSDLNVTGISTLGVTSATNLTAQQLNVSGVGTIATLNSTTGNLTTLNVTTGNINTGVVTTISGTTATYTTGNLTTLNVTTGNINTGVVTTISGTTATYTTGNLGTLNVTTGNINTGVVTTLTSTNATLTNIRSTGISTLGVVTSSQVFVTGIITATQFTTGSGNLGFTTNTISGPSVIIIDPSPVGVGTTSGSVRILGDLYIDGTQFIVNSTTIELADNNVGIASTVGTNLLLDGAGIGIGSIGIRKTITWNNTASALTSSEDWNLASGKRYAIGGTSVLNSTTLGTTVVNSSLTSVGTLGILNVTGIITASQFSGNINSGVGTIVTLSGTTATYTTGNLGTLNATTGNIVTGIITTLSGTTATYTTGNLGTLNATTGNIVTGIVTTLTSTNATLTNIRSTGISTLGITSVTNLTTQNINNSGITTTNSLNIGATQVISSSRQLQNIASLDATTTATIESAIANAPNTFTDLNVTGISTLGVTSTTNLTSQQLNVSGVSTLGITTFTGAVSFGTSAYFGDNDRAYFGDGNDLSIYHNGNDSIIEDAGSGNIYLQSNAAGIILQKTSGNENLARFLTDGAVELYYDNSKEFETTGYGATVFGVLQSQGLQVDGGVYVSSNVGIGTTNPTTKLDVRGTISIGRTDVAGINSIRSVIDINSWEYGGISKALGNEDTSPNDIYFKPDGTKMFIVGAQGDEVNEYLLSTAWDVSTAGFTTFFPVAAQEASPLGLYFSPDGLNMYVCGNTGVAPLVASGDYVHQYALGTAWDISNVGGATVGWTTSYRVLDDTAPQGVYLKNDDGTKMYVVGSTNDRVYEYALSTPWNVSSAGLTTSVLIGAGTTLDLPLTLTAPTGIDFNASGTKMYIIDQIRDVVARFDLNPAWDVSTAVFYDNVYIGFQGLLATGIFYQEDQSKAYVVDDNNNAVYQYNTDVPSLELASSGISTSSSIILNNEARLNNRLYVTGDTHISSNTILKGTLQVDGSVTTSSNLTVSGGTITAGNVAATLLGGNTTTNITAFGGLTSGTLTVGGVSQTGTITIDQSVSAHTLNIASGISGSGISKTVNIATGGASGSRTLVTVGSATAGAISTVTIPSPTNLLIGTSTTTGTASQPLQVNGGAYVSGNLGIGQTNPTLSLDVNGAAIVRGTITLPQNTVGVGFGTTTSNPQYAISQTMGDNDGWLIYGESTQTNTGSLVLEVNDDNAEEKIVFRNRRNYSGAVIGVTTFMEMTTASNIIETVPLLIGTRSLTGTASQRLQVNSGGYFNGLLGVGKTNPVERIESSGAITVDGQTSANRTSSGSFDYYSTTNGLRLISWGSAGTTGTISFWAGSGGSGAGEKARFDASGNLLINNTTSTGTASQPLQVTGGAYVSTALGVGRTNPGVYGLDVNGVARIGGAASGKVSFGTGQAAGDFGVSILPYSDRTEIQAEHQGVTYRPLVLNPLGGNVGIASTTPTEKLDVVGNIKLTGAIYGPTELVIDPAAVGDNTGRVRIKGDLYVDGTQTYINSATIELADFNVGIATTVGTLALLDGAGIGIGSTGISGGRKTITWNNTASALTSSEDWNLVSGKQYEINGTSVLSSTTLGSGVVNSSLTSVGTLGILNVTGIVTASQFNGNVNAGVSTLGIATATNLTSQQLNVSGISTHNNTAFFIPTSTGAAGIFSGTTSADLVRITQLGTGNALVVEDSANPDATPFVVNNSGNVGIGTTNPVAPLHIQNGTAIIRFAESDASANNRNWDVGVNTQEFYWQGVSDSGAGGGNLFKITRSSEQLQTFEGQNSGNTWFVVNNNTQRVGIGTTNPTSKLDVFGGNVRIFGTAAPSFVVTPTSGSSYIFGANTAITGGGIYDNTAAVWRLVVQDTTGNIGINSTSPTSRLDVVGDAKVSGVVTATSYNTIYDLQGSTTATTTTTSQTSIHTLSSSVYRSVEYIIQAVQSTNFHTTKILAVHNGTTVYLTEYGTVYNSSLVANYDVDISGGNIRLLATPASSSSTTFRISFTAVVV